MRMLLLALLLCLGILPGRASGQAQAFYATAGEHPGFTRLVLHTPTAVQWALDKTAREARLTVSTPDARIDLSRVFDRIPRTRLAEVATEGPVMTMRFNCDCTLTSWQERAGLIVIDIGDPTPPPVEPPTPQIAPSASLATPDPIAVAREAGRQVARRQVEQEAAAARPAPATLIPPADIESLTQALGRPVAAALAQGLLDPSTVHVSPPSTLLGDARPPSTSASADGIANITISTVLDRPDPDQPPRRAPDIACREANAMTFLEGPDDEPFGSAFGRILRDLYGEFDQPNPDAMLALLHLYLRSGFGAEARALIENSSTPITGRELLLGVSDIFEDRQSNSRMHLAQSLHCGGSAALFALLSGASASAPGADEIALTFSGLPEQLRAIVGPALIRRLIEGGEIDAARIVADSFRRSPWSSAEDQRIVDALLDRARGLAREAAFLLEAPQTDSATAMRDRLDLALAAHQPVSNGYRANAQALASAARNAEIGPALMTDLIRLDARDGKFDQGFSKLDRLTRWLSDTGENRRLLGGLRDTLWSAAADRAEDLDFVQLILAREDWRDDSLTLPTRRALATRLRALGLDAAAASLSLDTRPADTLPQEAAIHPPAAPQAQGRTSAPTQTGDNVSVATENGATAPNPATVRDALSNATLEQALTQARVAPTAPARPVRPPLDANSLPNPPNSAFADSPPPLPRPGYQGVASSTPRAVSIAPVQPRTQQAARAIDRTTVGDPSPVSLLAQMPANAARPMVQSPVAAQSGPDGIVARSRVLLDESARLRESLQSLSGP